MKAIAVCIFCKDVNPFILDWYHRLTSKVSNKYQIYCIYLNDASNFQADFTGAIEFVHDSEVMEIDIASEYAIPRSGWYKQQILKIGFTYELRVRHEQVIILDGDTFTLNPCMDGVVPLIRKKEPREYLLATRQILGLEACAKAEYLLSRNLSPIINLGIWSTSVLSEAIDNHKKTFVEWSRTLLTHIESAHVITALPVFSEYLWYCSIDKTRYLDSSRLRKPRVFRRADQVFGLSEASTLKISRKTYDIVAFENPSHHSSLLRKIIATLKWNLSLEWL